MRRGSLLWIAHRVALLTGRGRLVGPWILLARAIARLGAMYALHGMRDASAYARGGIGRGDFVPGLSDVDVILIVGADPAAPGRTAELVRSRWRAAERLAPALYEIYGEPRVYDDVELRDLTGASAYTYGLDLRSEPGRAAYTPDPSLPDRLRVLDKPGLYGPTDDWVLLAGRERRLPERPRGDQDRLIAAWLELGFYWRLVFPMLLEPDRPRSALLCVKLIAEPARIWLWLAHGERVTTRAAALGRALALLPEEEPALRRARELELALHRLPPPPLADAIATLLRFTGRIAGLVEERVLEAGTTPVALRRSDRRPLRTDGQPPEEDALAPCGARPLCDWRAIVRPTGGDEQVIPSTGHADDVGALREATMLQHGGTYTALAAPGLIVLPGALRERVLLRSVSCPATDPVSFALAAGEETALFPNVRGWSIRDTARRAIAEHRPRLTATAAPIDERAALVSLLTAARAALLHESLGSDPLLPLTLDATAALLGERSTAALAVTDETLGALHGHVPPSPATRTALHGLVSHLPAFRGG